MHITRIHAFKDNYIWLLENGQGQAVVVDPGDAQPVLDYLKANHLNLLAILITHHHADHTGGIAKLAQHYPCQVYGPAKETIRGVTQRLQHHEQLTLGHNFPTFTVLDCPGHTLGHIAFYSAHIYFAATHYLRAAAGACSKALRRSFLLLYINLCNYLATRESIAHMSIRKRTLPLLLPWNHGTQTFRRAASMFKRSAPRIKPQFPACLRLNLLPTRFFAPKLP